MCVFSPTFRNNRGAVLLVYERSGVTRQESGRRGGGATAAQQQVRRAHCRLSAVAECSRAPSVVRKYTGTAIIVVIVYRSLTMVVASAAVMKLLLNHTSVAGLHTPTTAAPSTHSGKAEVQRSHLHGGVGGDQSVRAYMIYDIILYVPGTRYHIMHITVVYDQTAVACYCTRTWYVHRTIADGGLVP